MVMRAVRLFNNACSEQIGEQIGGEQITALIYMVQKLNLTQISHSEGEVRQQDCRASSV